MLLCSKHFHLLGRTIGTYEGTKTLKRTIIVSEGDALYSERKVSFFSK